MERQWHGYWINNGKAMCAPSTTVGNAPYLRKTFECTVLPGQAVAYLCALGWHELYVNGKKVDDRVLAPVVTQYERHVSYIEYDITGLLKKGRNSLVVLLGNGWYNCHTAEVWSFDKASWRDWPKLLCDVVADGTLLVKSDTSWLYHDSPITFDALRNGERYNANLEIPGFAMPELDDSAWVNAVQCTPPGGLIVREDLDPCKVMRSYTPVGKTMLSPMTAVYDFGTNLTGWCEIEVKGVKGSSVTLEYSEQVRSNGSISRDEISSYVKEDGFQKDAYILKGDGVETFRPHFTYHGFRYVCVRLSAPANAPLPEIKSLKAQFIHNSFAAAGSFRSSDDILNRLQEITCQSYLSNFTGIPTDCPHREKNGWTGDAQIACETGLWNYDSRKAYIHFLRMLADAQRPSGQLPGIVPTGGWGYNWGSGPAWDNMLSEGVWQLYLFYGDLETVREFYGNMVCYTEYCRGMSEDNLVRFGLGDWCHWNARDITPVEFTSSCYYYSNAARLAKFAKLLGNSSDAEKYSRLASDIKQSFNRKFYQGNGIYGDGRMTELAAPLYFELAEDMPEVTAGKLAERVRQNGHRTDFGILGAKYVPRVLADYGYAEEAFKLITQKEFPGWGNWVARGATTLWENWSGSSSQNHIMFGDISAWMYQYLGGVAPCFEEPGFRKIRLRPNFVPQLDYVCMSHETPSGLLKAEWRRTADGIKCDFTIPEGCCARLELPGRETECIAGQVSRMI